MMMTTLHLIVMEITQIIMTIQAMIMMEHSSLMPAVLLRI